MAGRAQCRQMVLVVRVLRVGEQEVSLAHEVETAAQQIAGGVHVGG